MDCKLFFRQCLADFLLYKFWPPSGIAPSAYLVHLWLPNLSSRCVSELLAPHLGLHLGRRTNFDPFHQPDGLVVYHVARQWKLILWGSRWSCLACPQESVWAKHCRIRGLATYTWSTIRCKLSQRLYQSTMSISHGLQTWFRMFLIRICSYECHQMWMTGSTQPSSAAG